MKYRENLNYYGKLLLQNKLVQFLTESADGYEREWRFKFFTIKPNFIHIKMFERFGRDRE
jgi:hypothetical protein